MHLKIWALDRCQVKQALVDQVWRQYNPALANNLSCKMLPVSTVTVCSTRYSSNCIWQAMVSEPEIWTRLVLNSVHV